MAGTAAKARIMDFRCSECKKRGTGEYRLPVVCHNCGAEGVGRFSKTHRFSSETCPDCQCMFSIHRKAVP